MNRPNDPDQIRANQTSLMSVAHPYPCTDEAAAPPAGKPVDALGARFKGKHIRGKPWTNLKKLAQEHSVATFGSAVELMRDPNPCVRLGAWKLILKLGKEPEPARDARRSKRGRHEEVKVNVKIVRFGAKGKEDAR